MSAVQVFWKYCWKRRNCLWRAISPFPTLFSIHLENFLPFLLNLKLSSANCPKFVVWERVKLFWPNVKILELFISKTFQITKYMVTQKLKFRVESTVGKGENVGYLLFLLFPQCFQKTGFSVSLTLSQTNPVFYVSAVQVFWKHVGKGEIARNERFLPFPLCFLPCLKNILPFS